MKISQLSGCVCLSLLALSSCGRNPVSSHDRIPASVRVLAQVVKAGTLAKAAATGGDTLIVTVTGADFSPLRYAIRIGATATVIDTSLAVPPGDRRRVEVYTVNSAGVTVHAATAQTITTLGAGQRAELWFRLQPVCGSIYVSLVDVPVSVDSVWAVFRAASGSIWEARAKRVSKMHLSIDCIPDNTSGTLTIIGVGPAGDTLYRTHTQLTVRVDRMSSLTAGFRESDASISVRTEIVEPGVTLITASMSRDLERENGPLIITEIMYMANDSEYVELYNPTDADLVFDTLILEIDGTRRTLTDVAVASKDFFVIARRSLPWAQVWFASASALDLSSTTGNMITVRAKDQTVMDRVGFAAGVNDLEWPRVSGKASITLDSLPSDPLYNNYGRNWAVSTPEIDPAVTIQRGTPGYR